MSPMRVRPRGDRGAILVETVGAIILVAVISVVLAQALMVIVAQQRLTAIAGAAARAEALGHDPTAAAIEAAPAWLRGRISVRRNTAGGELVVRVHTPGLAPGLPTMIESHVAVSAPSAGRHQ